MADIEKFAAGLEGIPVALYRTALDGTLIACNEALAHLFGHESPTEFRASLDTVEDLYVDRGARQEWVRRINEFGVVRDFDVELRRKDGSTFWVRDTARVIKDADGTIRFFEGSLIDVTDTVAAQRARDEFIAAVSHELRNPISVLVGLGSELADRYDSFTDRDRRDMAKLISQQAQDAAGIIDDLLVSSRDDFQLGVARVEFDVALELNRVLEVVDHQIPIVSSGSPAMVLADPHRTRQILRNLVTNAIRYGRDPIQVEVSSDGDIVVVRVSDSGDPLAETERKRIFDPYQRGSGVADSKSVGLGLSVARRLSDLMGGSLDYDHDGTWSSFVLCLPAPGT